MWHLTHDSWEILLNSHLFHPPNIHNADVRSNNAPGRWIVGQTVSIDQADVRSGINFHRAGGCSMWTDQADIRSLYTEQADVRSDILHLESGCSVRHFAHRKRMFSHTFCTQKAYFRSDILHLESGCSVMHFAPRKWMFGQAFCT
jgi:hypothetical protein